MDASEPNDMDTGPSQQDLRDHPRQNRPRSGHDSSEPSHHDFIRSRTPTPSVPDKDSPDNNELDGLASSLFSSPSMTPTVLVRSAPEPPVPNLPTLSLTGNDPPRDEPDENEKNGYYYGLPSRPRLIARSSRQPWQSHHPRSTFPQSKTLQVVERSHPIAKVWCTRLYREIVEVLKNVSFTTIDVLRIGYPQAGEDEELPAVVLWIGVQPGSLSSRVGNKIVEACVEILRQYQLVDVQCEIRESEYQQSTSSPTYLAPETATFASGGFSAQLIASPGQSINLEGFTGHGTLGPYLRAGKDNPDAECVYAVTCRHVALPLTEHEKDFDCKRVDQPLKNILLPSDAAVIQGLKNIDTYEKVNKAKRLGIREKLKVSIPEERERLEERLERLRRQEPTLRETDRKLLSTWEPEENRVFGHVVTAPPLQVAESIDPSRLGSVVDWALIKVYPGKHPDGKVTNCVNFKTEDTDQVKDMACHHLERHPNSRLDQLDEERLYLSRVVPVNELHYRFKPIALLPEKESHGLIVGMKGASSGLTCGQVNGVDSVVSHRHIDKVTTSMLSMEVCVLSFPRTNQKAFSQVGDSGSVVFDLDGRVVGIVHGGSGSEHKASNDITYVSSMAEIQQGLNERGYSVEIA